MVCIYCGAKTRVANSRRQRRMNGTWRRHHCTACGAIFTSLERADYGSSLSYRDAASHIVPFDRDKLFISLYEACKHRVSAVHDASALVDTVLAKLLASSKQAGLVDRGHLIDLVSGTLKPFDQAADTYYLAYHRR